jgi:hypothetical protein
MNGGLKEIFNAKPGSYMSGLRTNSIFGDAGNPPHVEVVVEVGSAVTGGDGTYWCKIRYFDIKDKTWKTDTKDELLDPRGTNSTVASGDKIVAFFSQQRGAFIPIVPGSGTIQIRSFVLRTTLASGGFAVAQQLSYKSLGNCTEEESSGSSGSSQMSSASSESSGSSGSESESAESTTSEAGTAKRLCYTKDDAGEDVFFIVYDRLGEFAGWADAESETYSCGIAYKLPDTPTFDELCLYPEFFPEEYAEVNDVWEIMRMVCTNFYGCPCQTLDCEEDIYGQL